MGDCLTKKKKPSKKAFSVKHLPRVQENSDQIRNEYRKEGLIKRADKHYAVYNCSHIKTKKQYALRRYHLGGRSEAQILEELDFYRSLDHPFLMHVVEYFKSKNCIFVIMSLFEGKNLTDYIIEADRFKEEEASKIIGQLLALANYLHSKEIVNRDFTLRNLMYDGNSIRLLGFTKAAKLAEGSYLKKEETSLYYMAPEMIKGSYDHKVDIWAIGVIAYILITGQPPFEGISAAHTKDFIQNKELNTTDLSEYGVTPEAIDFLQKILTKDPKERASAQELMTHKWFDTNVRRDSDLKLNKTTAQKLKEYRYRDHFQSAIYSFLVSKLAHRSERNIAMEEFQKLDTSKVGVLSKRDLTVGLKRLSLQMEEEEIDNIFHKLDKKKIGAIEYGFFLEAVIDRDEILQEENLGKYFDFLDSSEKEGLDLYDFEKIFGEMTHTSYIRKKFDKYAVSNRIKKENFIKMLKEISI